MGERCNVFLAKGKYLTVGAFVGVSLLAGCATTVPPSKPKVAKTKHEYVVINKGSSAKPNKPDAQNAVNQRQAEYEKKRDWYNRKWVIDQEAEKQRKRNEYHQKYQQAQQRTNATAQQSVQAVQLPHYGLGAGQSNNYLAQQNSVRSNWNRSASARGNTRRQSNQRRPVNQNLAEHLSNAAIARTYQRVRYDGRYLPIAYPMGDVPSNIGVCTDTVIRSYRRLGIDLQRLVHEDMSGAFYAYPNLPKWGLSAPDPNIDHRRVHNLKVFFARHGQRLPVTHNPRDYRPGDLVTWHLGGDQEHIGLVVNRKSAADPNRYMIVHNIAQGDKMEDVLFTMPITGHYRFLPNRQSWLASAQ